MGRKADYQMITFSSIEASVDLQCLTRRMISPIDGMDIFERCKCDRYPIKPVARPGVKIGKKYMMGRLKGALNWPQMSAVV
jgi:hypothetical protein